MDAGQAKSTCDLSTSCLRVRGAVAMLKSLLLKALNGIAIDTGRPISYHHAYYLYVASFDVTIKKRLL